MIELQAITTVFIDRAIELTQVNIKKNIDARVIDAVHNKNDTARIEALKNWLGSYAAFQGFNHDDRRKVVDGILNFGDTEGCHSDILTYDSLIDKFHRLHTVCGEAAPLTKVRKTRNLVSLTSKALWCCYPNAIPIYDRYAQNVLWILCKMSHLCPKDSMSNDRYASFADVWFQIYEEIEPFVRERAERIDYPYKVRVFDRILWLIGQPNYTGEITSRMF